jgi:hypothetical protein
MASYSAKQLARARQAARKRGLPADLYINDWLQTVEDFQGKCAYCGSAYETLDHFIALSQGGGTSVTNCVPCCRMCNQRKQGLPLQKVWSISPEILERTRQYLASRKPGQRWQEAILALLHPPPERSRDE